MVTSDIVNPRRTRAACSLNSLNVRLTDTRGLAARPIGVVVGASVNVVGASVDIVGASVDVVGASVDVVVRADATDGT